VAEVREPVHFPFVGYVQPDTGVSRGQLQRSIASISDSGAMKVSAAILNRLIEEGQPQE
jgi:hypothetical protein